jgi:hypothetical protein
MRRPSQLMRVDRVAGSSDAAPEGESKRPVVESPWSQLPRECPRLDTHRDSLARRVECAGAQLARAHCDDARVPLRTGGVPPAALPGRGRCARLCSHLWTRSVLTESYLCRTWSSQEILSMETPGQRRRRLCPSLRRTARRAMPPLNPRAHGLTRAHLSQCLWGSPALERRQPLHSPTTPGPAAA